MNKKTKAAFTLIELLVVILIIGILVAVALSQYQKAVIKSRLAAIKPILTAIKNAQEISFLVHGQYSSIRQLDIEHGCSSVLGMETLFRCDPYFIVAVYIAGKYVTAYYCPTEDAECSTKKDFEYKIWFDQSSTPEKIECIGYTDLGRSVCKSENL